jgi:hypothetical protein
MKVENVKKGSKRVLDEEIVGKLFEMSKFYSPFMTSN